MHTRSLIMMLAILGVGVAALPAYAHCTNVTANQHYETAPSSFCWIGVFPCGGTERHWHIIYPAHSGHTYSQARADGFLMNGAFWGSPQKNGFSPNKSQGNFPFACLNHTPACNRCTSGSSCSPSRFTAYICH